MKFFIHGFISWLNMVETSCLDFIIIAIVVVVMSIRDAAIK